MQLLPALIEYKLKKRSLASPNPEDFRITIGGYLEQFLLPYQPETTHSRWLHSKELENKLEFPLETCLPDRPLRQLADRFYQTESTDFFTRVGFPENSRGVFQTALYRQRTHGQRGLYIYYVPRFSDSETNEHDSAFWQQWLTWIEAAKLPTMTHLKFFLPGIGIASMRKTLVESDPQKMAIWEVVTDLLLSRLYVGGYNVISELAMLLNIPCIIFLPPGEQKFPVEIKWNVQYVTRTSQDLIEFEKFHQSYICLERLLIPEP